MFSKMWNVCQNCAGMNSKKMMGFETFVGYATKHNSCNMTSRLWRAPRCAGHVGETIHLGNCGGVVVRIHICERARPVNMHFKSCTHICGL